MSKQYPGGIVSKTPVTPTSLSAPGVWTLNQQAAAQATNTWPFPRDPQFNYVTMLLHGDGSAGPVAATGVGAGVSTTVTNFNADASTNNFNVTINGDARSNNFTPYQADGYWSVNFTGAQTSPSLTYPSISAYDLGATSQWTYECWVYFASLSGEQSIFERWSGTGGPGWLLTKLSTNVYRAHFGASVFIDTSAIAVAGQWIHLAVSRDGATGSLFVDGVRQATTSSVVNFSDGTDPLVFGERNSGSQTFPFNGYISNARIVKGTYVYNPSSTSITVPTSPLTAITNTVFLGLQSYRYLDNSSNAATATIGSASSVQRISPFTQPAASLNTIATYGAGYFDGTGDWLQTPSNSAFNFSATDCTLEFWYYGAGTSGLVFEFGSSTPDTAAMQCEFSSGTLTFKPIGASSSFFAIQTNAWNYIAAVKTGTTYYLYINGTRNTASTGTAASSGQIINIGARNGGATAPITGYLSNFRVSNTARYTGATMTVPTTILSTDANTQLLTTQYNGGGNNSGFKDSSQFNFPITRNGNTTQGTFSPYGSNWSTSFNGSSDYLTTPQTTSLNIGTGTFTVEAFVYLNSKYSSGGTSIINLGNGANGGGPFTGWGLIIDFDAGGSTAYPAWYRFDGSITQYTSSTSLNVAQWYHLAVARDSSNNIAIWVNGTRVFSGTSTVTYNNVNSDPLNIGRRTNGSANSPNWMNGYISNGRVVIGSNVYDPTQTTITVPTTPLTAVTNTQLLVLQSNRFVDNSSASRTMTVAGGSPSVQRFSPFAPLTVYNPATYGGSGYFDGTGDYLTELTATTALNLSSGDWSISFWVYKTATANGSIVNLYNSAGNTSGLSIWIGSGGVKVDNGVSGGVQAGTVVVNAWSYIEVIRSSGTTTIYVNGVSAGTTTQTPNASQFGSFGSAADGTLPHQGYITDLRIVKGTALSSSVPTAPLTAITNTSLLLSYTNPAILDNAMINNLETVGNAQISTSVKKYGTGSMYFDGTGDNLSTLPSAGALGSGDWTVEFWWQWISNTGDYQTVVSKGIVGGTPANGSWSFGPYQQANNVWFAYYNSGFNDVSASATLNDGAWHHMAASRQGTSLRLFADGVLKVTATLPANLDFGPSTSDPFLVGYNSRNARYINGYVDDLRITKGVARYTANFTVPDQAFPNG